MAILMNLMVRWGDPSVLILLLSDSWMASGLKACGGDARVLGSDLRAVEKSLLRNI